MRFRLRDCPAILAVLLATAGAASAQQDAFCICLDPMDPSSCGGNVVIPVGVPTNIYLCLLNPSGSQVMCWAARITDSRQEGDMLGEWSMYGLDAWMDPFDYVVVPEPCPWVPNAANIVMLGMMQVRVLDQTVPIEFFVGPVPDLVGLPDTPGYVHTPGIDTPATVCSGDFDEPVFTINGVVAADVGTWGAIKSAYTASPAAGK